MPIIQTGVNTKDEGKVMQRNLLTIIFLVLILTLAACGGAAVDAPVVDQAQEVETGTLADEVDIHTVASVKDNEDVYLIDVREQWEYDDAHIPGVTLIPMNEVPNRLDEIPTDKEVILTCRSGNRSGQVTEYLRQSGFDNVHNMAGGIVAWQSAGYPVE